MPCLVLGSALAFSRAFAPQTQLAGRLKAQAHCLSLWRARSSIADTTELNDQG